MKKILYNNKGFVFLEIIIGVALTSIVFVTLLSVAFLSLNISASIKQTTLADALAKEEIEALRTFRDGTTWLTDGLGTVSVGSNNPYYLVLNDQANPPRWDLTLGTETTGIFTRKIVFDKVSRDPTTKNIESVYNILHDDPETRKVTVTVSWTGKNYNLISYLTNWRDQ